MSDLQNACKPVGEAGEAILDRMNVSHTPLSEWGLAHLDERRVRSALDVGCGGGANVRRLLERTAPDGKVVGADYSAVSVAKSQELNADAIAEGRCEILQANVLDLPFEDASFELVTAFETVYFWPEIERALRGVRRILRPGGQLLICNESSGISERDADLEKEIEGMSIYTSDQLRHLLEQNGFAIGRTDQTPDGWLCVVATRSGS